MDDQPLSFVVPPGIGDISWIYSKLVGLGRPLRFLVPRSNHDRALPYLRLLPGVTTCEYARVPNPARQQSGKAGPGWRPERLVEEASRHALPIELNIWLEHGNRIEAFMPDLPTEHHYTLALNELEVDAADELLSDWLPFVCFYCANRDTVRRWHGWTSDEWARLAALLADRIGVDRFVLIGADWDGGFAREVEQAMALPVLNLVGRLSLSGSLQAVRRSLCLVAFPSGIPILSVVLRHPTLMFYPWGLRHMINAWADPELIQNRVYKGMLFGPPIHVAAWASSVLASEHRVPFQEARHD